MQPMDYGGIEIDRCECSGLWFDDGKLSKYLSRWACAELAGGEQDEGEMLTCPRCGTETLMPYRAVGQHFHRCGSCFGISIKSAALDRLLACLDTSAWRKAPEAIRNLWKRVLG